MKSATEVIATDLDLLSHQLRAEFDALSGRSVLIAGGAGFLGYYLVQGALHWNRTHAAQPPIQVTVSGCEGCTANNAAVKNATHGRCKSLSMRKYTSEALIPCTTRFNQWNPTT